MFRLSRLLALALVAGVLLFPAREARAHAAFVGSDPADNSVLPRAPERLHLSFSEPVSPLVLLLVGPGGGEPTRLERFQLRDATLVVETPEALAPGSYALSWRVTSADGHPIGGTVVFSVGAASGAGAPALEGHGENGLAPLVWTARLALYLGLFLGVGALSFHAFVVPAPPLARRAALAMIAVGLLAVVPSAALHGLDLVGAPLAALGSAEVWSAALSSSYALTLLIALATLFVGLAAWFAPPGRAVGVLSVLALAGTGLALAASGHASAASPQWLTRPAVFLHGAGIAFWAGSLVPFMLVVRRGGDEARRALARFSAAVLPVVAVLAAAGAALAYVQVERLDALEATAYGRVLLVKLALLFLLFTLAAINRFSLTPAFARREPRAGLQLTRSARMEVALVCLILAVAALWRFTPPPRSLAAAEAAPVSVHLHAERAMAQLTVEPGRAGPVTATAHVVVPAGSTPTVPKEVTLSLSHPAAGIEPIRRPMARGGDGRWRAEALTLPVVGTWTARIDVLISDFEAVQLAGEVEIPF